MWLNATKFLRVFAGKCRKTAYSIGGRLLRNVEVKNKIQSLQDKFVESSGISALRILKEHEKVAFMDSEQIRSGWMKLKDFESLTDEQKACIQEITTKQVKRKGEGDEFIIEEWVKLKLYDKQKSLDSLSRMLGYDAPAKVKLDTNENIEITFDF